LKSELVITDYSLEDVKSVSQKLLDFGKEIPIWLFNAEMGTGKTTIIKAICEQLQVIDPVSSPTFSLVNEYLCKNNDKVFHFDFYRLNHEEEALDIGLYGYLERGNYCFLEWPDKIQSLLDGELSEINISLNLESSKRNLIGIKHYNFS